MNTPISSVYESREFSGGGTKLEAKADSQLLLGTGILDEGIDQAGSGVASLSFFRKRSTSSGTDESSRPTKAVRLITLIDVEDGVGGGGSLAESEALV
ncbi:hypothetical protein Tco_0529902 [Tanacetum coccineum]